MALKDVQTQFITQFAGPGGTLTGFIAASFRVWQWQTTGGTVPQEINAVALTVVKRDAIIIDSAALCLVCDGGGLNFLYSVDTTDPFNPVVLDSVDLSAP